jgi:hypothetical protein
VAVAQLLGAVFEKADESPVDVAEAEETEVVGVNRGSLAQGLKPDGFLTALTRR